LFHLIDETIIRYKTRQVNDSFCHPDDNLRHSLDNTFDNPLNMIIFSHIEKDQKPRSDLL